MNLKFKKLSNRWYCDIPYTGSIDDLEMVSGADTLCELISNYTDSEIIEVESTSEISHVFLGKIEEDEFGATYQCWFNDVIIAADNSFLVWLCPVTKLVFGNYPNSINLKIIENEH